jgi:hypothetical protein
VVCSPQMPLLRPSLTLMSVIRHKRRTSVDKYSVIRMNDLVTIQLQVNHVVKCSTNACVTDVVWMNTRHSANNQSPPSLEIPLEAYLQVSCSNSSRCACIIAIGAGKQYDSTQTQNQQLTSEDRKSGIKPPIHERRSRGGLMPDLMRHLESIDADAF